MGMSEEYRAVITLARTVDEKHKELQKERRLNKWLYAEIERLTQTVESYRQQNRDLNNPLMLADDEV